MHRLFERFGVQLADGNPAAIAEELSRLLRDEDAVGSDDLAVVFERARRAYIALCAAAAALERPRSQVSRCSRFRFR